MQKPVHSQTQLAASLSDALLVTPGKDAATEGSAGHKALIKSSDYLETMITESPDAIITLNQHFQIVELNPVAFTLLERSPQDAIGHHCSEVLCCRNLNRMGLCGTSSCPLRRVLQQKKALTNEELLLGTGHPREVATSVTPVDVTDDCYAVFTARDMSAHKAVNSIRANFISMVSHELRTPLNSVHGFIDLLTQGHMGGLNEEQRLYLGYVQDGVQQLVSIVEDILFITRSDVGQFEIRKEAVQLSVLVNQVISSLRLQALRADIALYQDIPLSAPLLYIDPQRIKQVLNNLLINAIKFTPPGGRVTISAQPCDEHFLRVSVSDTGYGIPAEDRPHIFERFYQSNHSTQSEVGGYGLGLSIAKLIVELHGGTIDFDTALDKGTTFYFTLPLYEEQES